MQNNKPDYNHYEDSDWVAVLTAEEQDNDAVKYFFYTKCRRMLNFIVVNFYKEDNISYIIGEFYEFLRQDNCKVLRAFKGVNNASLSSYLSQCFINHTVKKLNKEEKEKALVEYYCLTNELNNIEQIDEYDEEIPIREAFNRLNERDKLVLRLLVIENHPVLKVADIIWPYINSTTKDWHKLTAKGVQTTIGIVKKRAVLSLVVKLHDELSSRGMPIPSKIVNMKN